MNQELAIVTSLNGSIYQNRVQTVVDTIRNHFSDLNCYIYHENSFDSKFNRCQAEIPAEKNIHPIDLFEEHDWLEEFVSTKSELSPFNKAGLKVTKENYNRTHARFFFRKIVSQFHASQNISEKFLLWLDADVYLKCSRSEFDSIFFDWVKRFDIAYLKRAPDYSKIPDRTFNIAEQKPHLGGRPQDLPLNERYGIYTASETGILFYNISNKTIKDDFFGDYINLFRNGEIFKESAWTDTFALDTTLYNYREKLNRGFLRNKWITSGECRASIMKEDLDLVKKEGSISDFSIHDIFYHDKRGLQHSRYIV